MLQPRTAPPFRKRQPCPAPFRSHQPGPPASPRGPRDPPPKKRGDQHLTGPSIHHGTSWPGRVPYGMNLDTVPRQGQIHVQFSRGETEQPHPTPSPGKVLQPVRLYFLQTILGHCPQGLTMRSDDNTDNRPEVARRTLRARGALMACTPGTPTARLCGGNAAPRLIPSRMRHVRRTGSEQVRRPRPGSAEARGAGVGGWGDLSLFKPPSR